MHLIFSFSAFLSWTLFAIDLLLIGFLSLRAYRDGKFSFIPDGYTLCALYGVC